MVARERDRRTAAPAACRTNPAGTRDQRTFSEHPL